MNTTTSTTTTSTTTKPLSHIPAGILSACDYARLAPEFIAPDRFAYIAGGSGDDKTVHHNQIAFDRYAMLPRVLSDVVYPKHIHPKYTPHTRSELLDTSLTHPLLLAPLAYQTLVHPQGELATAQAAAATDSCMVASTLSSFTLEQIAENSAAPRWFQLYLQPRDEDTLNLLERAAAAGYEAVVVTLDAAVQVPSRRALQAGFQFPAEIQAANLKSYSHTPPASTSSQSGQSPIFHSYQQNAVSREKLRWLINRSPLPVLVKGILHPEDARLLKALGADGLIVSNHGGRTLDGVPASLDMLPAIRRAVGEGYPLLLDSGIRSGADVFKAIACGADAVLIGRLQVYALSVAGALGVAHMLKLLRQELELTMAMCGCKDIHDIKATALHRNGGNNYDSHFNNHDFRETSPC